MKRIIALTLALCLFLCGCGAEPSETTSETTIPETTIAHETIPTTTISATIATEAVDNLDINKDTVLESAVSQFKTLLEENFENYDLSYDETGITISLWQEGIAKEATLAINGDKKYFNNWNKMIENFVSMAKSSRSFLDDLGLKDVSLAVVILNDQNTENIITMIVNDTIVFDIVSESASNNTATTGEKNALKKANSYLSFTSFSYTRLIEQLEYDGFTTEEAVYGADNCGADWFEQAAKKAESYLSFSSFSRQRLIEQLEYEGFTHEQAVYGVEENGY